MKITYLTGYRYPNDLSEPLTSGDLRYSFTLSRALARLGHEVNVITRQEGDDPIYSKVDGVNIYRYRSRLRKIFTTSFDVSYARYKLFNKLTKDSDLVICNSPLSLEAVIKPRQPIIYIASGLEDTKNYSFTLQEVAGYLAIKILRDPLKHLTWKRSVLVNTTAWHEDKTLISWGVPKSKVGKISSSVDTSRFKPTRSSLRKKLNIKTTDKVILSVSRFTPAKGVVETVQAFSLLNREDTTLLVAGVEHSHDKTYFNKVKEEIETSPRKNQIVLLENIPEQRLPEYYSAADLTSVFSKGYDPLPTVIIESMACGTPVVSTYYKTREQFIENGETGLFVKEQNKNDWVDKVNLLLNNTALRRKISKAGLLQVDKNFDWIKIAKQYTRIIDSE